MTSRGRVAAPGDSSARIPPAARAKRAAAPRTRSVELLVLGDIDPLLPGEGRARGRVGGQEGEEPRPGLGVQRGPELRDLERLDVFDLSTPHLAVGPDDQIAMAV